MMGLRLCFAVVRREAHCGESVDDATESRFLAVLGMTIFCVEIRLAENKNRFEV